MVALQAQFDDASLSGEIRRIPDREQTRRGYRREQRAHPVLLGRGDEENVAHARGRSASRRIASGCPSTVLLRTASSKCFPNGSAPRTQTDSSVDGVEKDCVGHSTNRVKVYRNAALTWYSSNTCPRHTTAARKTIRARRAGFRSAMLVSRTRSASPRSRAGRWSGP